MLNIQLVLYIPMLTLLNSKVSALSYKYILLEYLILLYFKTNYFTSSWLSSFLSKEYLRGIFENTLMLSEVISQSLKIAKKRSPQRPFSSAQERRSAESPSKVNPFSSYLHIYIELLCLLKLVLRVLKQKGTVSKGTFVRACNYWPLIQSKMINSLD